MKPFLTHVIAHHCVSIIWHLTAAIRYTGLNCAHSGGWSSSLRYRIGCNTSSLKSAGQVHSELLLVIHNCYWVSTQSKASGQCNQSTVTSTAPLGNIHDIKRDGCTLIQRTG